MGASAYALITEPMSGSVTVHALRHSGTIVASAIFNPGQHGGLR
jgi:RNase P/RNase MRP subunit POP5